MCPLPPALKAGLERYNEKNQLVRIDRDTYNILVDYSGKSKVPIKEIIRISVQDYLDKQIILEKTKNIREIAKNKFGNIEKFKEVA